jgi:hypothetical protein
MVRIHPSPFFILCCYPSNEHVIFSRILVYRYDFNLQVTSFLPIAVLHPVTTSADGTARRCYASSIEHMQSLPTPQPRSRLYFQYHRLEIHDRLEDRQIRWESCSTVSLSLQHISPSEYVNPSACFQHRLQQPHLVGWIVVWWWTALRVAPTQSDSEHHTCYSIVIRISDHSVTCLSVQQYA